MTQPNNFYYREVDTDFGTNNVEVDRYGSIEIGASTYDEDGGYDIVTRSFGIDELEAIVRRARKLHQEMITMPEQGIESV